MLHHTPEQVGLSSQRLQRLDALMRHYVDQNKLPCTLTMIARQGKVVHRQPYGLMDINSNKPVKEDTIFRIYSMTKPLTSLSIMMLYEEGRFLLSDPVSKFIPGFKEIKVFAGQDEHGLQLAELEREITLHDLLTHTGGLTYGLFGDHPVDAMYQEKKVIGSRTLSEMVDKLVTLPVLAQPGTLWNYSVSTDVLGHIIELVSGQSLDDFFNQRIIEPLNMVDTAFYVPEEKQERFASLYTLNGNSGTLMKVNPLMSNYTRSQRFLSGGGGLVSTITDYMRFCQMLLNGGKYGDTRFVSRKTIDLMTMNHLPNALMPIILRTTTLLGYGFGLGGRVMVDVAQSQQLGSAGEYGWGGAASTYFFIDPQEELIGILMTQFMPSDYYPIRTEFKTLVYQALVD